MGQRKSRCPRVINLVVRPSGRDSSAANPIHGLAELTGDWPDLRYFWPLALDSAPVLMIAEDSTAESPFPLCNARRSVYPSCNASNRSAFPTIRDLLFLRFASVAPAPPDHPDTGGKRTPYLYLYQSRASSYRNKKSGNDKPEQNMAS
jgi:hypothetical protein